MANWDVIIVGGGPAGLSAALILGRCRRRVLVYDDDSARNRVSRGIHGFVGQDGIAPDEFRRRARAEVESYGVELRSARVVSAARVDEGFEIRAVPESRETAHKLLLATGVRDELPAVPGAHELYGRGLFPCAYCDGWELCDRRLAAYGSGPSATEFVLGLTTWSRDVLLFTDGGPPPPPEDQARLERYGVRLYRDRVRAFTGGQTGLEAVVLETGEEVPRDAVFLHLGQRLATSPLAAMLGCVFEPSGPVRTFEKPRTCPASTSRGTPPRT
jgi:thioredoxin reductase